MQHDEKVQFEEFKAFCLVLLIECRECRLLLEYSELSDVWLLTRKFDSRKLHQANDKCQVILIKIGIKIHNNYSKRVRNTERFKLLLILKDKYKILLRLENKLSPTLNK